MSDEEKEGIAILVFPPISAVMFYLIGEPVGAVLMGVLSMLIWMFALCIWLIGKGIR